MKPPTRFGVAHDFRCPPGADYTLQDVYAQTFEQLRAAGRARPRPRVVQRAPLRRGRLPAELRACCRCGCRCDQADADLDRTSRSCPSTTRSASPRTSPCSTSSPAGRMELGLGLGLRARTSSAASGSRCRVASRCTEECVDILRLAWSGERFSYAGKRYHVRGRAGDTRRRCSRVAPRCGRPRRAPACDRAVRYDTHVLPQGVRVSLLDRWRAQTIAAGGDPDGDRDRHHPLRSWSPTTATATGRRCAKPSATAWRCTAVSPRKPGPGEQRCSRSGGPHHPTHHSSATSTTCVGELTDVHRNARLHRRRHVGLGARPAASRAHPVDGAVRRRGRAAGPRAPQRLRRAVNSVWNCHTSSSPSR